MSLLENYPELSNIAYINERLEFYGIIESLDNYKNTKDEERLEEVYNVSTEMSPASKLEKA